MDTILDLFSRIFESAKTFWKKEKTHRFVSAILVVIFLLALAVIEINRQGLLHNFLASKIPTSHYMAINLAFSLVLILEVISLIFALPESMSKALGKQFEILALIFLRSSFKELAALPEPIDVSGHTEVLWHILSYGGGAVAIFGLLGIYLLLRRNLDEALSPGPSLERFIKAKKTVGLLILAIFLGMGIYNLWLILIGSSGFHFFSYFYTLLIFSDILLVLIAQSFLPQFPAVFRNSGYALATLLIRLSLTAPVYYDVLIGIFSISFALILTLVFNKFYTIKKAKG
jgi:hypothetical protein